MRFLRLSLPAICGITLLASTAAAQRPASEDKPRPRRRGEEETPAPRPQPQVRKITSPAPAPAPTSGRARYRVTVNGFTAHHETWDHALQVDGKRDEIYLTKDIVVVDKAHDLQLPAAVRTKVFGDVNGFRPDERIRAGNASDKGGIQNGNAVPYDRPWQRRGSGLPDRLPWTVWEGELVDGENAVTMIIAPWEYDGGKDAYGDWVRWTQSVAQALKKSAAFQQLVGEKGKFIVELSDLGLGLALSLQESGVLGNAQDRPIGLVQTGTENGKPVYGANPKLLMLNFNTAELALAQDFGMGRGVIPIRFVDDPKFAGDYEVYVQVERVP